MSVDRKRTTFDIILGVLLLLGGLWLLVNVVVATAFTVLAIAWTVLIGGVLLLISTIVGVKANGVVWSSLIGGAVLTVLGIFMLRNMALSALVLTLIAGSLFFVTGLMRVGLAASIQQHKWIYVISGVISILLGLWVVLNPITATASLLGILMGIQVLTEGLTLLMAGRLHVTKSAGAPTDPAPTQADARAATQ